MLLKLLRAFFGYVRAEVYGSAPERFMNLLIKHEIIVWDVERTEHGFTFFTGRRNLLSMKPYLRKTNMKIKVLEKRGMPYFLRRNRKRAAFVFGFLLFIGLLYGLSLFVWEVRIEGETTLVAETLLDRIEEAYIPLGTLKSTVDCNGLEQSLRKDYPEISWVSCELKGTVLTVHLEEGSASKPPRQEERAGDLVAAEDATITKMITRQGTPISKLGDEVKKGDILISGTIYLYDDNHEVIETSYIPADGDVFGTCELPYEDYVELTYYQKHYSSKLQKHITLYFLNYCLTPWIPNMKEDNYDTYTQIHKARLFDYFYLPFGYKLIRRTPYTLEKMTYDPEEAKKILNRHLQKKIKDFKEKGVEIMENNVKIVKENGKLTAKGTLTVTESIARFQENPVPQKNNDKQ